MTNWVEWSGERGVGTGRREGQWLGDSGHCACHSSSLRVCTGAECLGRKKWMCVAGDLSQR